MRRAVAIVALLAAGASFGETLEEERTGVQEKLEAEKAAFEALRGQKGDVAKLVEAMEKASAMSVARADLLMRQLSMLDAEVGRLDRLEDETEDALHAQLKAMGPRLTVMYRTTRQDRLGFLLSASDFATMIRRQRAMQSLVREDVSALEDARRVLRFEQTVHRRAEAMRHAAVLAISVMKTEAALEQQRRQSFEEVLALLNAEGAQKSRIIKDLEHAEYQLSEMLTEMNTSAVSGFRALRGHLPYPTRGMIEVGFGNVFNPRFNTVTLQKGLDFRARAGTRVIAVADGTVAYAGVLKGYGNLLILEHGGGYHTLMAHLSTIDVEPGDRVQAGDTVGTVGDTGSMKGAYLYFEIRQRGEAVDPAPWLDEDATPP